MKGKEGKERIVVYVSPVSLERLELLRGWTGARSRGEVVDVALDLILEKFEDEILQWAHRQLQAGREEEE